MMKYALIILALVIVAFGGIFLLNQQSTQPTEQQTSQESSPTGQKIEGYEGTVIAGSASPYLDFKQADYKKALKSDKVVFLNFYANWCPICRAEAPDLTSAFENIETDRIIGFRVNYNDSETDSFEKSLAEQFRITYQHTKVILVDGREVYKQTEQWDEAKTHEVLGLY